MAATVELKVNVDASKALASLNQIYTSAAKIDGKTFNLKINVAGLDQIKQLDANAVKAINALARQASAEASLARAEAQLRAEMQKTAQTHNQTATASERRAAAEANLAKEEQRGQNISRQRTLEIERQQTVADKAAAAEEAHARAVELLTQKEEAALRVEEQRSQRSKDKITLQQLKNEGAAAKEAASGYDALSVALGNVAARLAHMAFQKVVQGIREAMTEMKNVDTELVNISKVSGITGKALSDIGDRAYETASKYGVAASEYLSAVYTFQKAGLGDSAEKMGELAIKTMLVGDTTADVASQFLISANAAWKFGGNMERLSALVDEADYINNNYATDLEKLSSGLPRVASVAAQAGMSAEETLAALGTITAVTQESGTKAATALRALILNIEGQVGEFVDETGETFTVTEESVKSMQGLMEKYAKAELDAARASGELINPMTAIKAIFEGMANSDLDNQELFQLLSGMGGKLRTNQLTALVQNYELFDEMLGRIADSAGTADGEIALMMDSWERKTQVLKNTWTEFVQNIVNSDTIKNAIEGITEFVDGLNDLFTTPAEAARKEYEDANAELEALQAKSEQLTYWEKLRLEYLEAQTKELENQANKLAEEEAKGLKTRLNLQTVGSFYDESGNFNGYGEYVGGQGQLNNLRGQYREASFLPSQGEIQQYQDALKEIVQSNQEYYDQLVQIKSAGVELTDTQQSFVQDFEAIDAASKATIVSLQDIGDGYQALIDDQGNIIAKVQDWKSAEEEKAQAEQESAQAQSEADAAKQQRLEEIGNRILEAAEKGEDLDSVASQISFENAVESIQGFIEKLKQARDLAASIQVGDLGVPGFASGTSSAPGGPTLVNELGPELISQNGQAFIANGGRPAVVNLQRGAIVIPANQTRAALRGGMPIRAAASGIMDWMTPNGASNPTATYDSNAGLGIVAASMIATLDKKKLQNIIKKKDSGDRGDRGSAAPAAPAGPTIEELAKAFKDTLANLDKQAKLANNQGDYVKEVQIYEQAQEAIKKMVDDYRKAGYADDSDEILDLLNKNYDYANKQLSLYQTKWDELIKALQADTDAQEMANKLAEKQQAVEDAREALANAQKQRTIRMYNAATGQWEWVADQSKVSSAQEKLSNAEESYADEVKSQAVKELQAMRDTVTDLNNVILGPALSSVVTMAENSDEFQNFARALNAVYGIGSYLTSTEGNPKAISTADSHDTVYTFGNVTLTEEQASSMSVAQLAQKLSVLKIS